MVKLAYALSGNRLAAEEIAQEAFLAAYRDWQRVAWLEQPAGWVRKVVIRIAGRTVRRRILAPRSWPSAAPRPPRLLEP